MMILLPKGIKSDQLKTRLAGSSRQLFTCEPNCVASALRRALKPDMSWSIMLFPRSVVESAVTVSAASEPREPGRSVARAGSRDPVLLAAGGRGGRLKRRGRPLSPLPLVGGGETTHPTPDLALSFAFSFSTVFLGKHTLRNQTCPARPLLLPRRRLAPTRTSARPSPSLRRTAGVTG